MKARKVPTDEGYGAWAHRRVRRVDAQACINDD